MFLYNRGKRRIRERVTTHQSDTTKARPSWVTLTITLVLCVTEASGTAAQIQRIGSLLTPLPSDRVSGMVRGKVSNSINKIFAEGPLWYEQSKLNVIGDSKLDQSDGTQFENFQLDKSDSNHFRQPSITPVNYVISRTSFKGDVFHRPKSSAPSYNDNFGVINSNVLLSMMKPTESNLNDRNQIVKFLSKWRGRKSNHHDMEESIQSKNDIKYKLTDNASSFFLKSSPTKSYKIRGPVSIKKHFFLIMSPPSDSKYEEEPYTYYKENSDNQAMGSFDTRTKQIGSAKTMTQSHPIKKRDTVNSSSKRGPFPSTTSNVESPGVHHQMISTINGRYYIPIIVNKRDPTLITLSRVTGCPFGQDMDNNGRCKTIFQYTVNYGNRPSHNVPTHRRPTPSRFSGFLWNRGRKPLHTRPKSFTTIRELARALPFYRNIQQRRSFLPLAGNKKKSATTTTDPYINKSGTSGEVTELNGNRKTENLNNSRFNLGGIIPTILPPTSTSSPITTTTDHDD